MAYQSLYRRYRPQRFGEVKGQAHVTRTLANAVRDGRVAHAYLFSGPRGTGKTSTARILAKALNCERPEAGEPCGTCDSCVTTTEGRSLDVVELDAASNRGIDAMRDLVARVSLAPAGQWKTYIVDEVHMLTTEAANTLLKTLEEPPPHVVFVLATTEPQKVLPTIQSRTQHFEFRLLGAELLADHLRWVAADADLEVAPEAIDLVVRRGSGSARDALSALDQVAAAGGVAHEGPGAADLVEALCERDATGALVAVAERCAGGHDPRQLARELIEHLRDALLVTFDRNLVGRPDDAIDEVEAQARRLGRALAVRAMEELGTALVEMREAPDPRVVLEVAVVRLCRPELDVSPAALLERLERLERAAGGGARPQPDGPGAPAGSEPSGTPGMPGSGPAAGARLALGGLQRQAAPAPAGGGTAGGSATPAPGPAGGERSVPAPGPAPGERATPAPGPAPGERATPAPGPALPEPAEPMPASPVASGEAGTGERQPSAARTTPDRFPTRDELTLAWGDGVLAALPQRARARFRVGRFVTAGEGTAVFALPDAFHRQRCVEVQGVVEEELSRHFGQPVRLRLAVDEEDPAREVEAGPGPRAGDEPEDVDPGELTDAPPGAVASPVEHVLAAFEGAEIVED